jgi:hypothetical protein
MSGENLVHILALRGSRGGGCPRLYPDPEHPRSASCQLPP